MDQVGMVGDHIARSQGELPGQGGVHQGWVDLAAEHTGLPRARAQGLSGKGVAAGDDPQAAVVLTGPVQGDPECHRVGDAKAGPPRMTVLMPEHRKATTGLLDQIGTSERNGIGIEDVAGDGRQPGIVDKPGQHAITPKGGSHDRSRRMVTSLEMAKVLDARRHRGRIHDTGKHGKTIPSIPRRGGRRAHRDGNTARL